VTLLVVAVVLQQAASCPARAAAEAKAAYVRVDHAAAELAAADVEACTDGDAAQLAEALRWRAQARFALGNADGALEALVELATVLPTYDLDPLLPPKLHELYRNARVKALQGTRVYARLKPSDEGPVEVEVFGPAARYDAVGVELDTGAVLPAVRSSAGWIAQREGAASFARAVVLKQKAVLFRGPAVALPAIVAKPPAPVAAAAPPLTPQPAREPIVIAPAPAEERPRTLLWVGVGVGAVAVAAVVAGIAIGMSSARPPRGSLGQIEIP
jgi:hypothetical protein